MSIVRINQNEFLIEWDKLSTDVKGYGARIIELAKVNKLQFRNAKARRIKNPLILASILRAGLIVQLELEIQYSNTNISQDALIQALK